MLGLCRVIELDKTDSQPDPVDSESAGATAASDVPLYSADPFNVKRAYRPCDLFPNFSPRSIIIMLDTSGQDLQLEISQLESRLHDLRSQLDSNYPTPPSSHPESKSPWTLPAGM